MNKKLRAFIVVSGVLAVLGGVLMIVGAIMEDAFPKALWFVAAICFLLNTVSIGIQYRYLRDKDDKTSV